MNFSPDSSFDIIIIGGGHAGIEAAMMASRFPVTVGLVTLPGVPLASAPCNPSVGGVGKGHLVREIDALGGVMGILTDRAGIHYRTLNESKGFAVQATRVQIDKELYTQEARKLITLNNKICLIEDKVQQICPENGGFKLILQDNANLYAKKVILTAGTFLNGRLHIGPEISRGGRYGAPTGPAINHLMALRAMRFKTGTPPRLRRDSIDFSQLNLQPTEPQTRNFHWENDDFTRQCPQISCYTAQTNPTTMEIIRQNKAYAPLFNGQIQGKGPRYCPSIEDKAFRYPDRNTHHFFLEPEGLTTESMYPSGLSTSLPKNVQLAFMRSIKGLENVAFLHFGYAVEYDVIDSAELDISLEHQKMPGLYCAGQINGTSGYEEAAGQGLIAAINAVFALLKRPKFKISRYDGYLGVMIEDLVSNTMDEPYRLFSARAENRPYLREDNAILRMAPYRKMLGLQENIDEFQEKFLKDTQNLTEIAQKSYFFPENAGSIEPKADFAAIKPGSIGPKEENLGSIEPKLPSRGPNPGPIGSFRKNLEEDAVENSAKAEKFMLNQWLKRSEVDPIRVLWQVNQENQLNFSYDVVKTVG
ncbi:MAG: tRNA uridine-5-carboxymethylaminomethyl(34) synthesis enzyme MnmG, partial [Bacteriovoracaceae bacterium]|nr:tRNA uridine-5-carboxymethylaminomethyl(34) synthesis enzyme MnmG [Bacteriovoracaceae bacterium]